MCGKVAPQVGRLDTGISSAVRRDVGGRETGVITGSCLWVCRTESAGRSSCGVSREYESQTGIQHLSDSPDLLRQGLLCLQPTVLIDRRARNPAKPFPRFDLTVFQRTVRPCQGSTPAQIPPPPRRPNHSRAQGAVHRNRAARGFGPSKLAHPLQTAGAQGGPARAVVQ